MTVAHPPAKAAPVSVEIGAATSRRRAIAGIIDAVICAPVWVLLSWATWPGDGLPQVPWNWLDTFVDWVNAAPIVLWGPILWLVVVGVAYNLAMALRGKETFGKQLLGLRTLDRHNNFPTPQRSTGLAAARGLSTVLLMGGHLWALADPERRTMHDRLAGVWVAHDGSKLDAKPTREAALANSTTRATTSKSKSKNRRI